MLWEMWMWKMVQLTTLSQLFLPLAACHMDEMFKKDDDNNNDNGGITVSRPTPQVVYAWQSTTTSDGDIGGLNGANTICEMDAPGISGLQAGLTHQAVIQTSGNNPENYFGNDPIVRRPNRQVISNRYLDFINTGASSINTISGNYDQHWTGIGTGQQTCNDWTSNSLQATGYVGSGNSRVTARISSGTLNCDGAVRILCISY